MTTELKISSSNTLKSLTNGRKTAHKTKYPSCHKVSIVNHLDLEHTRQKCPVESQHFSINLTHQ
ncbi:TPA: hypothetical protein ACGO5G_001241, partial [Streptococcus suis]